MDTDLTVKVDLRAAKGWREQKLREGYAWDDELNMPRYRAVAWRLCHAAGVKPPVNVDIHHIDHDKQNDTPTNLIMLSPIAHVLVHMATAWWSGHEQIGNLMTPTCLLAFLNRARIAYLYLGSLVRVNGKAGSHDHDHDQSNTGG